MALRAYAFWAAAGEEAQYDEKAKRLLGNKTVLAHILIRTIDEFNGMGPRQTHECIHPPNRLILVFLNR